MSEPLVTRLLCAPLLALLAVSCSEPPATSGSSDGDAAPHAALDDAISVGLVEARRLGDGSTSLSIEGVKLAARGVGVPTRSALGVQTEVPLAAGGARVALDLPPGARLVQPRGYDRVVEIVDAKRAVRARVRADDPRVRLRPDGPGFTVDVAGGSPPPLIIVDWTPTSAPLAIRDHHTATLLPTGDVLFVGGYVASFPTATTEIYDGTTGRFRAGPPLAAERAEHSATMRDDGRVMIIGGVDAAGALTTTAFYDALINDFTPGPALGVARASHTATRLADRRTLVVGGDSSTSAEVLNAGGTAFAPVGSTSQLTQGAAALLQDGRVVVLASPLQVFDPATDTFSDGAPVTAGSFGTMTRLGSGAVVVSGMCPSSGCSVGGATPPSEYGVLQTDGSISTTASELVRGAAAASLLPSGELLFTGGAPDPGAFEPPTNDVSALDFFQQMFAVPDMAVVRSFHTSTLLPSGSTLVVGGAASVDLFLPREVGGLPIGVGVGLLQAARADFAAVTLLDGAPLVSGGRHDGQCLASVERVQTWDMLEPMAHARTLHTLTLLEDGRVLAVGGECDGVKSSELYDPIANHWTASGAPNHARSGHTSTLLFDGRVLVVGGFEAGHETTSSEIWSPSTGAFVEGPYTFAAGGAHAASILPSGRVLVVGENHAAVFDPATDQFTVTALLGAAFGYPTATLLPSGKVFIAGKKSQNGLVYDDMNESFAFTGPVVKPLDHHEAVLLPSGRVALIGGLTPGVWVTGDPAVQLFDPLAAGGLGGFIEGRPLLSGGRGNHRVLLALDGSALVIGGEVCQSAGCPQVQFDNFETWNEPSNGIFAPTLDAVPAMAVPGDDVAVLGAQFRGLAGSSGTARASDAGFPIPIWQSVLYGGRVIGAFTDVTSSGATWRVPSTPFRGPGVLRISTNATLSFALPVEIGTAVDGHTCAGPHECASGVCADGFCCDTPCDGPCLSCSGLVNGTGIDGVCVEIPANQDPLDACVIGKGGGCTVDTECSTGFCVDGVCCESLCGEQCEACDVDGNFGECTPVLGPPHGGRTPCATSADACDNAICDGVDRVACAAVVGPCIPYACGATACETTCNPMGNVGCAEDFRCTKEGVCVPRLASCDGSLSTSRDGVVTDCSPYNCQADGSCREACGSVLDCADPFVCDPTGRCVARGADTVDEGCALEPGRAGGASWALLGALGALGWIRARSGARRRAR